MDKKHGKFIYCKIATIQHERNQSPLMKDGFMELTLLSKTVKD